MSSSTALSKPSLVTSDVKGGFALWHVHPPACSRDCWAQSVMRLTYAGCDVVLLWMQLRALDKKASKPEKIKNAKGGHRMWEDVFDLGEKIRSGQYKWEDLDLDDLDVRLKWSGLFHRKKRAPGTYMMRLKVGQSPMTLTWSSTPC